MKTLLKSRCTIALLSCTFVFALFFSSCNDDEISGIDPDAGGDRLVVNYRMERPATMGYATASENEIKEIAVIFFNNDGTYKTSVVQNVTSSGSSTGKFTITLPSSLDDNTPYKTLILGNYNEFLPYGTSSTATYIELNKDLFDVMKKEMISGLGDKDGNNDRRIAVPLLFSGEGTFTKPAEPATATIDVTLLRTMSRIDVHCTTADLDIEWVKVCNYRTQGHPYHQDLLPGGVIRGFATSSNPDAGGRIPSIGEAGAQFVLGGLYAYPNISYYPVQDDLVTTGLLIAARYKGSPTITYYRANVSGKNKPQVLRRNGLYELRISKVSKEGSDTEEGAITDDENKLDYEINDWEQDNDGGTIIDPEGNFITINPKQLTLTNGANNGASVSVSVKPGGQWNLSWHENTDPNVDQYFRFEDRTTTSFRVATREPNLSSNSRSAILRISLLGTSLYYDLKCIQRSVSSGIDMLTVDGKSGIFDYEVPISGGLILLPVLTGSSSVGWTTSDADLTEIASTDYITSGGDGANLAIRFHFNYSEVARTGKITVNRKGGGADPVTINFKQAESRYPVNISFAPEWRKYFDANTATKGGSLAEHKLLYTITIPNATKYKWKATSPFDINNVSISSTGNSTKGKVTTGNSTDVLYIHIAARGLESPGQTSSNSIVLELIDITTGLSTGICEGKAFTVYSSFQLVNQNKGEYVRIGKLLIYDRFVGVVGPDVIPYALNYIKGVTDNTFKGLAYDWHTATLPVEGIPSDHSTCPIGWHVPTKVETQLILDNLVEYNAQWFIKGDNKNTDRATHVDALGCFFPLTTDLGTSWFWCSSARGKAAVMFGDRSGGVFDGFGDLSRIRCVKAAP